MPKPVGPEDLIAKEEEAKNKYVSLPDGVTIDSIRRDYRLPPTAQLLVRFWADGFNADNNPKDQTEAIEIKYGKNWFKLKQGLTYVVGVNETDSEWLYLNPLEASSEVLEESNIPLAVDKALADAGNRKSRQIVIEAFSPDADIESILVARKEMELYREVVNQFRSEFFKLKDNTGIVNEYVERYGLGNLEKGTELNDLILGACYLSAETMYYDSKLNDKGRSVEDCVRFALDRLTRFIGQRIVNKEGRLDQLREQVKQKGSMAMVFDDVALVEEGLFDENIPITIITTYIPGRGWSVSYPCGACPSQAVGAIDNYFNGNLEGFNRFRNDIEEAMQNGELDARWDSEGHFIRYNDTNKLSWNEAVFHGDGSLVEAMQTLRIMADPVVGERIFKFILFKDDSEIEVEPARSIRITFDD